MAVTLPSDQPAHGNTLRVRGEELGGGRGASGAMQRKGIAWRRMLRERRIPCDKFRRAGKV